MFFGDGPIQVMRFFPSLLFLSPVLLCEAKAQQVLGTGDPSVPAIVPSGLWVLGAETAQRRDSADLCSCSSPVLSPLEKALVVQAVPSSHLFSHCAGGFTELRNPDTLLPCETTQIEW